MQNNDFFVGCFFPDSKVTSAEQELFYRASIIVAMALELSVVMPKAVRLSL